MSRYKYEPNPDLRDAIIFDIDGTLAHMEDRSPFDWRKVGEDKPDEIVMLLVEKFYSEGFEIIFMSGRDEICRDITLSWLDYHLTFEVPSSSLFMRPHKDFRKDCLIKEELFKKNVATSFNVRAVVDDRPQVVRMWYDIGIPKVICVGNPWKEF